MSMKIEVPALEEEEVLALEVLDLEEGSSKAIIVRKRRFRREVSTKQIRY